MSCSGSQRRCPKPPTSMRDEDGDHATPYWMTVVVRAGTSRVIRERIVLNQAAFFDLWTVGRGWIRWGSRAQPKAAQTRSSSSWAESSRVGSATRFLPANHLGSMGLSQGLLVGR